jgi:hypothetical protein
MSKTNSFETAFLNHLFTNANIDNIGDATGLRSSSTAGNLHIALFTTAPTESAAGTEANYTGYARVAVVRSGSGWTVVGNQASNAAAVTFGECTGGTNNITSFGIMTAGTSGDLLLYGTLTSNLSVSTGITPQFAIGALTVTED